MDCRDAGAGSLVLGRDPTGVVTHELALQDVQMRPSSVDDLHNTFLSISLVKSW
jgi:hypothetical protein